MDVQSPRHVRTDEEKARRNEKDRQRYANKRALKEVIKKSIADIEKCLSPKMAIEENIKSLEILIDKRFHMLNLRLDELKAAIEQNK
jgi:hypothetical protein